MSKWVVFGTVVGSKYLGEYEAATAKEAVKLALNAAGGMIHLCHQCVRECEDGEITSAVAEKVNEIR